MVLIYHMCSAEDWENAPEDYHPPTFKQDGFAHACSQAKELVPIANHFYKASTKPWICLTIDTDKLSSEVKFEPPSPVGDTNAHTLELGPLYPHVYGSITKSSVVAVSPMLRAQDGTFLSIQGLTE
eukprot:c26463_g1_i1.p1 GENE.c26463_g1_i1~~c26463_g1_i1.p1  ORF type:complete len:139 (+),score=36.75 c26463_g1_i1:40-417(+)